jgi:pilus assembly protein CpaE
MYPLTAGVVIADRDLSREIQACLRELRVRVVLEQPAITRWAEFQLQMERSRPDVLVFDLSQPRFLEEAIRRIRALSSAPVIAVHDAMDAETILGALRAGAREYVYPPYLPSLQKALERISTDQTKQHAAKGLHGRVLGFLSAKGGCGATTIACHLAWELQRVTQQEILLADLDMSAGMIGFLTNSRTPYSVLDAVRNIHRLDLSYWKALVSNGIPRLEVITAPTEPVVDEPLEPEPFRDVLRFVRSSYDWVIADLGRGLNFFSLGLLEEMDEIFLVTHLEVPALYQTKNVVQQIRDVGFLEDRLHVIVNRAPRQSEFTSEEVERLLGVPIHTKLPNAYPDLYEAFAHGRLVSTDTQLGKQFTQLATSLAGVKGERVGHGLSFFGLKKTVPGWEGV